MEFEQTCRFVAAQIPVTCAGCSISKDALNECTYYFVSHWTSLNALFEFTRSPGFLILQGSFNGLGRLQKTEYGEISELNLDHTRYNDLDAAL